MINSETKLFGIIGNPVRHSLSPVMHNVAFSHLGLNCVYLAFHVQQVKEAIQGIKALGIKGLSVTIPHKSAVIQYLDWVDPIAEKMGAVNTIVNENNLLKGYNTDGMGAYRSITETGFNLNGKNILIIGNGGTAKAIAYTILDQAQLNHLYILGRNQLRVNQLTTPLIRQFNFNKITSFIEQDLSFKNAVKGCDVIINTTPIGMSPNDQDIPITPELISDKHIVFDVVYKPVKTRLLQESEKRGATLINGLEMLVNQGVVQFELWTQQKAPKEIMLSAIKKTLQNE